VGVSFLKREGGREKGMEGREMGRQDSTVLVWIVVANGRRGRRLFTETRRGWLGAVYFFIPR